MQSQAAFPATALHELLRTLKIVIEKSFERVPSNRPKKLMPQQPTIFLALTDDWELRGDGSGDPGQLQFEPLRKLLRIYKDNGVTSTFNVEVMQQLTFREFQEKAPELKPLADAWDDAVRDAFRHCQDIQLHIHPQWSNATYRDGRWCLPGDWALPRHDVKAARSMLERSKHYLEGLLQPLDRNYKCVAFRSGSSCIAPSSFALSLLAELGIVFDMSIVGGLRANTRNLQMDYSQCEESFLPFYPRLDDARKVSDKVEPIICVPIFHFYLSRRQTFKQVLSKVAQKLETTLSSHTNGEGYSQEQWAEVGRSSRSKLAYDKAIKPCLTGKYMVSDLSQMNYAALKEMLAAIRSRARQSGLSELPVILTGHSKYMKDFSGVESFVRDVSQAPDIKFATLTDIATKLRAGHFAVRSL